MSKGILIVISGPSGAGKGTIVGRILSEMDNMDFSVSMTTREPREGDVHGREYYFVTSSEFEEAIRRGEFLEYACVHDNYYGTPRSEVTGRIEAGRNVVLDIDVQGALQIMGNMPDGLFIFLEPPSMQELRKRLVLRGKDTAESIEKRLKNAEEEMRYKGRYDYVVVNDDLEMAVKEVKDIILKEVGRHDAISGDR